MKIIRPIQLALIALCLSSCALFEPDEPWTFALSREIYDDTDIIIDDTGPGACFMLAVFLLPLAIDLVCLPVTLPHDLAYVE